MNNQVQHLYTVWNTRKILLKNDQESILLQNDQGMQIVLYNTTKEFNRCISMTSTRNIILDKYSFTARGNEQSGTALVYSVEHLQNTVTERPIGARNAALHIVLQHNQ